MSRINRDKWLEIWEPERYVMSRRDKWLEIWGSRDMSHVTDLFWVFGRENFCSIDRICDNFFSFDLVLCKSKWIKFQKNVRFYRARSKRSETFHLYGCKSM